MRLTAPGVGGGGSLLVQASSPTDLHSIWQRKCPSALSSGGEERTEEKHLGGDGVRLPPPKAWRRLLSAGLSIDGEKIIATLKPCHHTGVYDNEMRSCTKSGQHPLHAVSFGFIVGRKQQFPSTISV